MSQIRNLRKQPLNFCLVEKAVTPKDNILDVISTRTNLSNGDKKELKEFIDEIKSKKGQISPEGIVTCYYALSKYNKRSYDKDGTVGAGSDKIMLSTHKTSNLKKFGDIILTLYVPIEKLYFVAITKEEVLMKIPFRSSKRKMNIKQYL